MSGPIECVADARRAETRFEIRQLPRALREMRRRFEFAKQGRGGARVALIPHVGALTLRVALRRHCVPGAIRLPCAASRLRFGAGHERGCGIPDAAGRPHLRDFRTDAVKSISLPEPRPRRKTARDSGRRRGGIEGRRRSGVGICRERGSAVTATVAGLAEGG